MITLPTYEETLKYIENRVERTKDLWEMELKDKSLNGYLSNYYEGQHSEAQRVLEFLKTGVPF
jgi:hypothetical protein